MTTQQSVSKANEWQHKLLVSVSGLLVFETLTGLLVWLMPFSVSGQVMVLLHTILGLVFIVPYAWYQIRHWLIYKSTKLNHYKLTGYFSVAATVLAAVSGVVLSYQAVFSTRISYAWDLVHIVSTFALVASVVPHIVTIVLRNVKGQQQETVSARAAEKRFGIGTLSIAAALFVLVALTTFAYQPVDFVNEFPVDYVTPWGADRPFAPSLARTSTG